MSLPTLAHPCFSRGCLVNSQRLGQYLPLSRSLLFLFLDLSHLSRLGAALALVLGSLISPSLPQSQAQGPFCSVRVKGAGTEHPPCGRSGAQGRQASAFALEEPGWVCRDRVEWHRLSTFCGAGGAVGIVAAPEDPSLVLGQPRSFSGPSCFSL